MPALKANVLQIRAACKGSRAKYTLVGHPGLYLYVRGDGTASWVVRFRIGGVVHDRVLSNDAARADFETITSTKDELRLVAKTRGVNLMAERQAEAEAKLVAERAAKLTLETVINQWITKPRKKALRPRTQALYRWTFDTFVIPKLGKRAIGEINKDELRDHFKSAKDRLLRTSTRAVRGEAVGKAFTYLQAVFEFAVDENYIVASPMRGLSRPVPTAPERKSSRPPRAEEVRAIWQGSDVHLSVPFGRMIKLALLLGRRRSEIVGATVDEFTLADLHPHWIIPPREGNKSQTSSLVPLPRAALAIIKAAIADAGSSPYLFPQSPQVNDRPTMPDALSLAWRDLCKALGIANDVNLHDARGLFTDALEQMGVPDNVISHCLHHTSDMKSTTAKRVYSTNQFREEKLRALRLWQARLLSVVSDRSRQLKWAAPAGRQRRFPSQ